MMACTDRHFRYLMRLISKRIVLYTEMIHTGAIIHGERDRFLTYHPLEHPIAIQLGGCDPQAMAQAAKIAADYGYDEININVGCPSGRVQSANFGACLMAQPQLVADCVFAIKQAVNIPVTVKTRIGIDDKDDRAFLENFIGAVAQAGCECFIIHARKAWLQGLSPKENRSVPPLQYERVAELAISHPELRMILNGGIKTKFEILDLLTQFHGVMIGREIYANPFNFQWIDREIFAEPDSTKSQIEVLQEYLPYVDEQRRNQIFLKHIARHLLSLFSGQPGAKSWRRYLSENMHSPEAGTEVIRQALTYVS